MMRFTSFSTSYASFTYRDDSLSFMASTPLYRDKADEKAGKLSNFIDVHQSKLSIITLLHSASVTLSFQTGRFLIHPRGGIGGVSRPS
jgi:hypothetical protein